jgi:transposase
MGAGPVADRGDPAVRKQHHIRLTPEQRAEAEAVLGRGRHAALTTRRARILLEADERPGRRVRTDRQVAELCGVSARTVARARERFAADGFAAALRGRPRPGAVPKLTPDQQARIVALACTPAPDGRARWSVRLLAARVVELEAMPPVSRELVRATLKKTGSSPGASSAGRSPASGTPPSSPPWRTS